MIATRLTANLTIAIGGELVCRDGHTCYVHRLVVEPESRRVTDLVVEHGMLRHRVVVPIAYIEQKDDDRIQLALDKHQIAALPLYVAVDFSRPDTAWTARHGNVPDNPAAERRAYALWGVPPDIGSASVLVKRHLHTGISDPKVPLGPGTRVVRSSGMLGHLDQVLLDPRTHEICALMVCGGPFRTREAQVPVCQILGISEGEIRIADDQQPQEV